MKGIKYILIVFALAGILFFVYGRFFQAEYKTIVGQWKSPTATYYFKEESKETRIYTEKELEMTQKDPLEELEKKKKNFQKLHLMGMIMNDQEVKLYYSFDKKQLKIYTIFDDFKQHVVLGGVGELIDENTLKLKDLADEKVEILTRQ